MVELNWDGSPDEVKKEKLSPATDPEARETVAVHVVLDLTATRLGVHATEVIVPCLLTVREKVLELRALLPSPMKVPVIV